jgi:hypothetical protein
MPVDPTPGRHRASRKHIHSAEKFQTEVCAALGRRLALNDVSRRYTKFGRVGEDSGHLANSVSEENTNQTVGRTDKRGQFVLPVSPPAPNADALFEQAQAAEDAGQHCRSRTAVSRLDELRSCGCGAAVQSWKHASGCRPQG